MCAVHPDKLDASGEVTHIATESEGRTHRMLCLHSQSGAAIWDVSAQELIAVMGHKNSKTAHSARQSGAVAAACWIPDSSKGDFATGHAGGDVNVWALPAADELQPRLLSQLRVSAAPSRGICALEYVGGKGESLLVFGGGHEDHPDGLMLLPLPEALLVSTQTVMYCVPYVLKNGGYNTGYVMLLGSGQAAWMVLISFIAAGTTYMTNMYVVSCFTCPGVSPMTHC